jgi:hypothetical protein
MSPQDTGELYLTKTRLTLLAAVEAGNILDDPRDGHTYWCEPPDAPFRVDARVREAEHAGWIALDEEAGIQWHLTALGQSMLDEARGGENR